jgi:hypothetical protein
MILKLKKNENFPIYTKKFFIFEIMGNKKLLKIIKLNLKNAIDKNFYFNFNGLQILDFLIKTQMFFSL